MNLQSYAYRSLRNHQYHSHRSIPIELDNAIYYLHRFLFYNHPFGQQEPYMFFSGKKKAPIVRCIYITRHKICSDPRDGFLGMQDSMSRSADYEIPVHTLFTRFTLQPEVFEGAFADREENAVRALSGLPSWVPDWTSPLLLEPWTNIGGRRVYYASGQRYKTFDYKELSAGILSIAAFEEDVIVCLGGNYQQTVEGKGFLRSFEALKTAWTNQTLGIDTSIIERFWRTLIANLTGSGPRHPPKEFGARFRDFAYCQLSYLVELDFDDARERTRSILEYFHTYHSVADLPTWEEVTSSIGDDARSLKKENAQEYIKPLRTMSDRWRFFVTAKGRIGIASQAVEVNDLIYIVKGNEYPLLMRCSLAGRLQFLSLAYIDGIMFGESLETNTFRTIEIE